MPVSNNAPVRSGSTRGLDDCATEDPLNPQTQLKQVMDALVSGGGSASAVTGARGARGTPPMPGAPTADDVQQDYGLDRLGVGDVSSNDPNAASARSAIRSALGMSDATPLNNKTIGDAVQARTPQVLDMLKQLGLEPGNSLSDPKTVGAIKQLQEALGVEQTGKLDLESLLSLVEAAQNRRNAAAATARPSGGSKPAAGGGAAGGSSGSGGGGGAQGLGEMGSHRPPAQPERSTWQKAQDFAHDKLGVGPGSAPTGTLRANQKEAYNAAIAEGLSPTAAKALVANMTGESLSKPNDNHWDVSHMSQGIVQWDPSRAAAIKRQFGKEPKDMTVAEQTKAAVWEMKNKYPKTYQALQGNDPQAMISSLVRDYERPANPSGEIAKRMQHYNNLGNVAG